MSMILRQPVLQAAAALLARQPAGGCHALIVLRLQGMRQARLRHGFGFAEQIWQDALARVRRLLRSGDEAHTWGEDALLLALPALRNETHAQMAVSRLITAFNEPLAGPGQGWHERVVLGVALQPVHGQDIETLCLRAERAHDHAVREGRAYAFHRDEAVSSEIVYGQLREAILGNQLELYLQPLLDLRSGQLTGAEALARWHPDNVAVPPADFIGFAERSDLIAPLTRWSIHAALRHLAQQRRRHAVSMAINLSPRVFTEPSFAEQLLDALAIWNVPASALIVEVTETALLADLSASAQLLQRLREHGVRVAIDDFGTGYASFAYLRHFPATELKIDRSFVSAMAEDTRTCQLVGAMIEVAHRLDLVAVAEGVEDAATLSLLKQMQCDVAQGYHIGRPMPAAELSFD